MSQSATRFVGKHGSSVTCWPRQIRGPALNGRKINGFLETYVLRRSSSHRSGSKTSASEDVEQRSKGYPI